MSNNPHTITVDLGSRSYPIVVGPRTLGLLGRLCREHEVPPRTIVIADRNSAKAGLRQALASLRREGFDPSSIIIPPGERQKSLRRADAIHSTMLAQGVSRGACVIALGGGVVGDVAGFVASTFRRGVTFVQCPTTLLSQVDSSVGGKNGVNHPRAKNAIGTFLQPVFVLSDTTLLRSLPRREIVAGLGEVLKYHFVGDSSLLDYVELHLDEILSVDPAAMMEIATRCLSIKSRLVSMDEKELLPDRGRVLLNVGHAVGHGLETLSNYRLRHGEAVFLGIIAEGSIAVQRGWLPSGQRDRLTELHRRLRCRFDMRGLSAKSVIRFVLGKGKARFVLPRTFGQVTVVNDVTETELREGLGRILAR
jgi:3-dehydroquinate synthase